MLLSDIEHNMNQEDELKIRPCEWYKEEYRDCKSIQARFHQYFIYGTVIDCGNWYNDYKNCTKWEKLKDKEYLQEVIKSEYQRKHQRLKQSLDNDVWELRDHPPNDWNSPLPDCLVKNHKNSLLEKKQREMKNCSASSETSMNLCTIM